MRASSGFDRARALAATLPGVTEGTSYGSPALKVGGKLFACMAIHRSAEPGSLAVRMSMIERDLRVERDADKYYVTPHYVGHPVVLARLNRLNDEELRELLEVGWQFQRSERRPRRTR